MHVERGRSVRASAGWPCASRSNKDADHATARPHDGTEDRLDGTALVLSRSEREEILEERGYSRSAIADAVRTNVKIKNNRRQTVHNLPVARFEEVAESVRRKVKRVVLRKGKKDEQTSVRYSRAPVVLHSDDSEVRRRSSLRGSKNAAEAMYRHM